MSRHSDSALETKPLRIPNRGVKFRDLQPLAPVANVWAGVGSDNLTQFHVYLIQQETMNN